MRVTVATPPATPTAARPTTLAALRSLLAILKPKVKAKIYFVFVFYLCKNGRNFVIEAIVVSTLLEIANTKIAQIKCKIFKIALLFPFPP
jgi:hypothetical protein